MTDFVLIGMRALTHVHVGEGQARGAIDLPVAREEYNGMPVLPGSSAKGALRSLFPEDEDLAKNLAKRIFGPKLDREAGDTGDPAAGKVGFGDGQLMGLPVRSAGEPFRMVTAPVLLDRFSDYRLAAGLPMLFDGAAAEGALGLADRSAVVAEAAGEVILEDIAITDAQVDPGKVGQIANAIAEATAVDPAVLKRRLVVVPDEVMRWLAAYALPVRTRNSLDRQTKTVKKGALWAEETLPPETLFCALWHNRTDAETEKPIEALWEVQYLPKLGDSDDRMVQIGGNETVGQGWVRLHRSTAGTGQ